MSTRKLQQVIPSVAASDGAGVKLRRSLGSRPSLRLDPFLMLDEFYSDNPDDYLAGFPPHPHRGFETVTYMLDGHMRHEDHLGNRGDLGPGDVQWMTAARGIVHSEMPQQSEGRMRGFQLWLNLPAAEKMKPAHYRDVPASSIPRVALPGGGDLRVIAGRYFEARGPVNGGEAPHATDPQYFDVRLPAGASVELPVPAGHSAFVYAYDGAGVEPAGGQALPHRAAVVFGDGDSISLRAGEQGLSFLLLAARPLREPVVQYGPFVMNTTEEINQAIRDYQEGRFAQTA
ncbi:MAG TPA: pirin family protein [Solimonas sp.]|nr:pirin family protein [Solimonas sp.]